MGTNIVRCNFDEMKKIIYAIVEKKDNPIFCNFFKKCEVDYPDKDNWWKEDTFAHLALALMGRVNNSFTKAGYIHNLPINICMHALCESVEETEKVIESNEYRYLGAKLRDTTDLSKLQYQQCDDKVLSEYLDKCLENYFEENNGNDNCLNRNGSIEVGNYKYNLMIFKNYYELLGDNVNVYPCIEEKHIVLRNIGQYSYKEKYNLFVDEYCEVIKDVFNQFKM